MYKESDFSKCLFNPFSEDVFKVYPRLLKIKEIATSIDNKLMKYIICVYDYRSPIVVNNRELKIRKQLAAELVGYDLTSQQAKEIFNIENDDILLAIDFFLKNFIHNRTWYMICSNESIFWEYGKRMLKPISETDESGKRLKEKDIISAMADKTKLSEDMQSIDDRLDAAYKKLYGDDMVRLYNRGTTPETIAKDRKYVQAN